MQDFLVSISSNILQTKITVLQRIAYLQFVLVSMFIICFTFVLFFLEMSRLAVVGMKLTCSMMHLPTNKTKKEEKQQQTKINTNKNTLVHGRILHQHQTTNDSWATTSNFNCIIMCSLQFIILHYYLWVLMLLSCLGVCTSVYVPTETETEWVSVSLMLLVLFYLFS